MQQYIIATAPDAVIIWHSQAGAVYAATCGEIVSKENLELLSVYTDETPYKKFLLFDSYPVSGDAESWVTTLGIPALTVELETRTEPETEINLPAVQATLEWLSNQ